uniref:Uncharacterized protein n=1 Tax=Lactuca sativa TaxID=4236 RepID=A0A9R1UD75_LACSA|nr:hypothetical protein LSAT_V11C900470040 [Lactuca sativa]
MAFCSMDMIFVKNWYDLLKSDWCYAKIWKLIKFVVNRKRFWKLVTVNGREGSSLKALSWRNSNKHVNSLRRALLPYPDLCTQLFEGVTATYIL